MEREKGFSASTLKIIAMIAMVIDHFGLVLLERINIAINSGLFLGETFFEQQSLLPTLYFICRKVGRISFPIFAFLLVEGFQKTKSLSGYIKRVGIFAILSEVPFDLALSGEPMNFSRQNIFFSLLLGLLTMTVIKKIQEMAMRPELVLAGEGVVLVLGACLGEYLRLDYGGLGILSIGILYLFSFDKVTQMLAGAISFVWEIPAPLAFIPLFFYNQERGKSLRYFFYLFYPLHLLVLYGICAWMGIGGIAVQ